MRGHRVFLDHCYQGRDAEVLKLLKYEIIPDRIRYDCLYASFESRVGPGDEFGLPVIVLKMFPKNIQVCFRIPSSHGPAFTLLSVVHYVNFWKYFKHASMWISLIVIIHEFRPTSELMKC